MPETAQIELEYLMTVHADLAVSHVIDTGSRIVHVTGGWAEGPDIKAKLVAPGVEAATPFIRRHVRRRLRFGSVCRS